MFKRIFSRPQTSILSAATVIALMVAVSRILGLVKNRLLTARFSEAQLDPFYAAFRIPDFIFDILVAGAISVSFIPVITSYLSKGKDKEAYDIASSSITLFVIILAGCSILFFVLAEQIIFLIVPGFSIEAKAQVVSFSRIMIIFQIVPLLIGNFFVGILQSHKQFMVPALAPVVYNIGIIIGIVFLTPTYGLYGAVYGVVIGSVLFMAIQIPLLTSIGFRYRVSLDLSNSGLRKMIRLMVPRTIGITATQIDATVDVVLASLVGAGSVTVLTLARQLSLVPLGLFGLSIAQAALPIFSDYAAKDSLKQLRDSILTSLHQTLFLIMPASVFLIVMRVPVVRLVYGADLFTWPATVLTGRTLAFFSLSLFAQAIVQLLSRAFYALHDTKTPVIVSVVSVILNTTLSIIFIYLLHLPLWSLGLSASIATIIHSSVLIIFLDRRLGKFDRKQLLLPTIKIIITSLFMAISLYIPMKLFDQLVFDTTRTFSLLLLTGTASCMGLATYLFFAWFFNIEEVITFMKFAQKLIRVKDILMEPSQEVIQKQ